MQQSRRAAAPRHAALAPRHSVGRRGCLALGFLGQSTLLALLVAGCSALPQGDGTLYGVLVPIGMAASLPAMPTGTIGHC